MGCTSSRRAPNPPPCETEWDGRTRWVKTDFEWENDPDTSESELRLMKAMREKRKRIRESRVQQLYLRDERSRCGTVDEEDDLLQYFLQKD